MLNICACCTAPIQLASYGLFPCSPMNPQLAVSFDMLELVSELFMNMAPNERGQATTITKYLEVQGFTFRKGVCGPASKSDASATKLTKV